jgi:hypothetical protein
MKGKKIAVLSDLKQVFNLTLYAEDLEKEKDGVQIGSKIGEK